LISKKIKKHKLIPTYPKGDSARPMGKELSQDDWKQNVTWRMVCRKKKKHLQWLKLLATKQPRDWLFKVPLCGAISHRQVVIGKVSSKVVRLSYTEIKNCKAKGWKVKVTTTRKPSTQKYGRTRTKTKTKIYLTVSKHP